MPEPSPWSLLPAAEYEAHMGPDGLDRLAPLSAIFGKACRALRPARILVLGCATGNGLEHVDPRITRRVVGVDLNIQYLAVARQRNLRLGAALELYCEDVLRVSLPAGAFDLVHAALVLEHVDPLPLVERIARWLAPGGVSSAIVELPAAAGAPAAPVSPLLGAIAARARPVDPAALGRHFESQGMVQRNAFELPLARGGRFFGGLYRKPAK
jgi:SAM-dependent methyltransferase